MALPVAQNASRLRIAASAQDANTIVNDLVAQNPHLSESFTTKRRGRGTGLPTCL
jgi:hypothetical protein